MNHFQLTDEACCLLNHFPLIFSPKRPSHGRCICPKSSSDDVESLRIKDTAKLLIAIYGSIFLLLIIIKKAYEFFTSKSLL